MLTYRRELLCLHALILKRVNHKRTPPVKDAYRLLVIVASLFCFHLSASNTAGVWKGRLTMTGASGEMRRDVTLRLEVNGSGLTGTMTAESETVEILDGTVKS